jgi:hypothetical protein
MPVVTLPDGTTIDLPDQRAIAGGLVRRVAPALPGRLGQLEPALRMPPIDATVPDLADMDYEKNFEGITDALYEAASPGFDYGSEVKILTNPYRRDDALLKGAETSPVTGFLTETNEPYDQASFGQGYSSNIRHGIGTSLIRDKIMEMISPLTEASRTYNPDDPSFLTRAGGNIGAVLATFGEEASDLGSYAKEYYEGLGSLFDPAYYSKVFAQPTEDILANLQGLLYTSSGSSPQQKYEELMDLYSRSGAGIFTPALNRAIEDAPPGRVITQQNIIDAVRADRAARAQESREEKVNEDYTGGGGTVVIGAGDGLTKTVSPRSREAMYAAPARKSEPPPFRRF